MRELLQSIGLSLARGAQMRPPASQRASGTGARDRQRRAGRAKPCCARKARPCTRGQYRPFRLNLKRYAHFTLIRRYADLIVHRALIGALGFSQGGSPATRSREAADQATFISTAERRAMAAERDTVIA